MPILFQRPVPVTQAMLRLAAKELLPTGMSAADLRQLSRDIRARSLFSARTTHLGYLEEQQRVISRMLSGEINIATARAELQDALDHIGYTPESGFPEERPGTAALPGPRPGAGSADPPLPLGEGRGEGDAPEQVPPAPKGSLQDLSSDKRLKLILETQTAHASNFALRQQGMDDLSRFQFPAWELVRIAHRDVPRDQMPNGLAWPVRFVMAGGQLVQGRMVALKDHPVWAQLGSSDIFEDGLDSDIPPYAFNSGMGWREVPREESINLGLISGSGGESPRPTPGRYFDEHQQNADQYTADELNLILKELRAA